MMKERAIELAKSGEKVFYICMNGVDSNTKKEDSFPYLASKPSSSQQITRVTLFELITKRQLAKFGVEVINRLSTEFNTLFDSQKMTNSKEKNFYYAQISEGGSRIYNQVFSGQTLSCQQLILR